MMCEKYEDKLIGLLNNELTPAERVELEKHLTECPGCSEELAGLRDVWEMMGEIETPEPSSHMRVKFQAMLDTYKESVEDTKPDVWSNIREQFGKIWQLQTRWPLAYSLVIVLVGFGLGYWLFSSGKGGKPVSRGPASGSSPESLRLRHAIAAHRHPA